MQDLVENTGSNRMNETIHSTNNLHDKVNHTFIEAHQLVFHILPELINELIQDRLWLEKNFSNFGEYALDASSAGLNISNNNKLWLLKRIMDIHGQHALEWGDVLNVVDGSVRNFAKKNKIQVRSLQRSLEESDSNEEVTNEDTITYLPSRAKSNDGQLLKLRSMDQEAYHKVTSGEMHLKDAFPKTPRKHVEPIESVKNKFNSLSSTDREAFIAWIDQQKE